MEVAQKLVFTFFRNQQENPFSHLLQHRLSIIKEVSEDSSRASTPQSSPMHQPLWQNIGVDHTINKANRQENLKNKQYSDYINSNNGVKGDNENLTGNQDICIHTSVKSKVQIT